MSIQKLVRWSKVVPVLLRLFALLTQNLFTFSDVEWVFADDERESNPTTFKFMAMAHAWKMSQAKNNDGGGGGGAASLLSGFTAAKVSVEKEVDANSDEASSHGDGDESD